MSDPMAPFAPLVLDQVRTLREVIVTAGYGPVKTVMTEEDNSPWVCVDIVRTTAHDAVQPHEWKFAVWRRSVRVFALDSHGAVQDDPVRLLGPGHGFARDFADAYAWEADA